MAKSAVIIGDPRLGITRSHPFAAELVPKASAPAAAARERGTGVELDPGLGLRPADVVITKHRASAFAGTDLDLVLRAGNVDTLTVAGVATSAMVAATAYDAADRDFRVRVAAEVCADPDDAVHRFLIDTLFPARGFEIVTGR